MEENPSSAVPSADPIEDNVQFSPLEPPGGPPLPPAGSPSGSPWPWVGWLYTANPFYLLSALSVLLGLQRAFAHGILESHTWQLMGILGGYTVVLALCAIGLVRLGRVWDDVRMILLIIVLLFLALAVSFDQIAVDDPESGGWLLCTGFALSLLISEGLFRGIPIRLPWTYRTPYYLLLALFFLYPLALGPLQKLDDPAPLRLTVAAFGPLSAGVFLLLLPAVRQGAAGVAQAGVPWPWPQFPWSLFVFLTFDAGMWTYYLTVSFVPGSDLDTFWRPYLLAPLVLAWAILLLEAGLCRQRESLQLGALGLAAFAAVLTLPATDGPAHQQFVGLLSNLIGSPPFLVWSSVCLFFCYAWMRGARGADAALLLGLTAMAWTQRASADLLPLAHPHQTPLFVALLAGLGLALWRRTPERAIVAASIAALTTFAILEGSPWAHYRGELAVQLLVTSALAVGLFWDGALPAVLRRLAAVGIMLLALMVATNPAFAPLSSRGWLPAGCLALWSLAGLILGWRVREGWLFFAGCCAGLAASLATGQACYALLATSFLGQGLDLLAWGAAFLVAGLAISMAKAGFWQRAYERFPMDWR